MPQRQVGERSWIDDALTRRGQGRRDALAEIDRLVDWRPFERSLSDLHQSTKGEAAYPPLLMFKVLLLQRWHALSDPAMEAALFDRVSFLRFVGLSAEDETPDHTTIWRFRQKLAENGRIERLFEELVRQLDTGGVMIKQGTLIDASLVQSAARRPRMDEGKTSAQDPEARFGANNERGRFTFGYKMHVGVDEGSTLVRRFAFSPGNLQEVTVAPALVPADAGTVYADRAYDAASLHAHLAARGLGDGIMRRARANQPLSPSEIARNHDLSLKRRAVEAVFGTLKRCYGFHRMRYFSAARNKVAFALACIAYNLRRWQACASA